MSTRAAGDKRDTLITFKDIGAKLKSNQASKDDLQSRINVLQRELDTLFVYSSNTKKELDVIAKKVDVVAEKLSETTYQILTRLGRLEKKLSIK